MDTKKKTYNKIVMFIIDAVLIAALIGLDRLVKYLTVSRLKDKPAYVIWENVFEFQYLENRGSAFGMLENQKVFLLFVGFVFMAVLLFVLCKLPNKKKYIWSHITIAFLMAGGIGNMIDRFLYEYVIDTFSFVLIHFPIFNMADIFICVATATLLILFLFVYKEEDLDFLKFKQNKYREI